MAYEMQDLELERRRDFSARWREMMLRRLGAVNGSDEPSLEDGDTRDLRRDDPRLPKIEAALMARVARLSAGSISTPCAPLSRHFPSPSPQKTDYAQ